MGDLKKVGDWALWDAKYVRSLDEGSGIENLKSALPDDKCAFGAIYIEPEKDGVPTRQIIVLQWKGPKASGMKKVKANQQFQLALETIEPNHGHIEVLGKKKLTIENIMARVAPGSGSKVISADDDDDDEEKS